GVAPASGAGSDPANASVPDAWRTMLGPWQQRLPAERYLVRVAHRFPSVDCRERSPATLPVACASLLDLHGREWLTAEAFLRHAASLGLFGEVPTRRIDASRSTGADVRWHLLAKRPYHVRAATDDDLDRLEALERLCWKHTRMPRQRLADRILRHPGGQFVLEEAGEVRAALYSQRIRSVEAIDECRAESVHRLHDPAGPIVQLLAVNVDPAFQNLGYGDHLLEYALQLCEADPTISRVVGVTLCKAFDAGRGVSFDAYLQQEGLEQDPILAFHRSHGAEVVRAVTGYRPEDRSNGGAGVLVSYDLSSRWERQAQPAADHLPAAGTEPMTGETIAQDLYAALGELLAERGGAFDPHRPLMEMGLDSADLLAVARHVEQRFGTAVSTGFFFEFNTAARVVGALAARLGAAAVRDDARGRPEQEEATSVNGRKSRPARPEDVAIVGVACRLPGGIERLEDLWETLAAGRSVIGEYPRERGPWPDPARYPAIDRGGFLDDGAAFDADFFRMAPTEVRVTDPQQRLLLELGWTCLEDACIVPAALAGSSTGVFVGASNADYSRLLQRQGAAIQAHYATGSALSVLANRLSYFFDLSGPSMLLDTACSSSLVALHAAIRSLRSGECTAALVGGVNFLCDGDLSLAYHKAGMLAADGLCKTFDARADGYVRAEGGVMLFLKPLSAALSAGDRIQAVLRGSATNHGGLAGGLTVPNPLKQSELLLAAWRDADVTAKEIGFLEAHGTGTPLGDPIEIEGIRAADEAFEPSMRASGCRIGSVKTKLGHLESAAGLAGLLEAMLALRAQAVPPTAHLGEPNPRIELGESGFSLARTLDPWPSDGPRVAGVSSFGSGGTNAHVVVEEAPVIEDPGSEAPDPAGYLLVLSASNGERLRALVERIVAWTASAHASRDLPAAIRTWQLGRTVFPERLAVPVRDVTDLQDRLVGWLAGTLAADHYRASGHGVTPETPPSDALAEALEGRAWNDLAAWWVGGVTIPWERLYQGRPEPAVSLPTYPFARERYWLPDSGAGAALGVSVRSGHPLLARELVAEAGRRFGTRLTGEEPFLSDHHVRTPAGLRAVLPAAAMLEMARAACLRSSGDAPDDLIVTLRDVAWLEPVVVQAPVDVQLVLAPTPDHAEGRGATRFEVVTETDDGIVRHSRGIVSLAPPSTPRERLERDEILARTTRGEEDSETLYERLRKAGLAYGPAHQPVRGLWFGEGELLAALSLPEELRAESAQFGLHPSLLDGALQAAVRLVLPPDAGPGQAPLPFSLATLTVYGPCPQEVWVRVRESGTGQSDAGLATLDLDLFDDQGGVCASLRGFGMRWLRGGARAAAAETPITTSEGLDPDLGVLFAEPVWTPVAFENQSASDAGERHVVLCGFAATEAEALAARREGWRWVTLPEPAGTVASRYRGYAEGTFDAMRELLSLPASGDRLLQVVVRGKEAVWRGLSGLLKSANLEDPRLSVQLVLLEEALAEPLDAELSRLGSQSESSVVRWRDGRWERSGWRESALDADPLHSGLREDGVYLITGGLGGLGGLLAREVIERTTRGRVIVTGRGESGGPRLEALGGGSDRLSYRRLDLADGAAAASLIESVLASHGRLDGIVHCAGMIRDSFVSKKDRASFSAVLTPKVEGTYHLDAASADVDLDFFVLFSSVASALGNVGQTDYAAANGFMDGYAADRNALVAAGHRRGRTVSVNWPLWRAGGMAVDEASARLLRDATGMVALEADRGLDAFHRSLGSSKGQVLVLRGEPSRLRETLRHGRLGRTAA
ncbi:MAG: SDR family NAD(P)-dependent oxidoreductase, partial [Myxococcota bacterium]|nr:SDR family NAD(P)-dependent oxidoreductase [Myxococcota bacterium]